MKWYCNFIENLPYVRKFLHIFWVGNLVNINFWLLTLTVFINFDGCWIMVVKNTPFFQVFQLSKISRKSQKLTNFCFFFFSSSFKIFRKNGGDWPSTFWSYPLRVFGAQTSNDWCIEWPYCIINKKVSALFVELHCRPRRMNSKKPNIARKPV